MGSLPRSPRDRSTLFELFRLDGGSKLIVWRFSSSRGSNKSPLPIYVGAEPRLAAPQKIEKTHGSSCAKLRQATIFSVFSKGKIEIHLCRPPPCLPASWLPSRRLPRFLPARRCRRSPLPKFKWCFLSSTSTFVQNEIGFQLREVECGTCADSDRSSRSLLELPACFSRRPEHRRIDESDLNMIHTMNTHAINMVLVNPIEKNVNLQHMHGARRYGIRFARNDGTAWQSSIRTTVILLA